MDRSGTEMFSTESIARNGIESLNDIIEQLRQAHANTNDPGYLKIIELCESRKKIFEDALRQRGLL